MHPAVEALTPFQAREVVNNCHAHAAWVEAHAIREPWKLNVELYDRAAEAAEVVLPEDTRRSDAKELREFVERCPRLAGRLRQVAQLCLEDGATLNECAARLGIARETVRAHLRRLRLLVRRNRRIRFDGR